VALQVIRMYSSLSPSMVSSSPLPISRPSAKLSHTGTSVELRHVRSTTPGSVLNPTILIDRKQISVNTQRRVAGELFSGLKENILDTWAYNETLFRVDNLANTEHRLDVQLPHPGQMFVRSVLPSSRKRLIQTLMSSSTT